ncbi:MAG: YbhN family protein [Halobacteriales archaeon]
MVDDDGGTAILDQFAERRTLTKTVVGFVVAAILLYLLGFVAGWDKIVATLRDARPRWLALACLSTLFGLVAWGKAWQVVLAVIGIEIQFRRLVVTYFAATFANYVTPFGQAGGEPFIAYVLSQDTGASYEDSLASVVTADLLNLLPFFNFAAVGLAALALRAQLPSTVRPLAVGLTALAVAIPAFIYAGWNYRDAVEAGVLRLLAPIARRTERLSIGGVRDRIEQFYGSLEVLAAEPRELLYALVFSYLGWVLFALPLYFAALTIGREIDLLLVLFIVPASTIAGVLPTPGGTGGVETVLVLLLGPLVGLTVPTAAAMALVYRVASYWFAIVVGGIGSLYVVARA